MFVIPCKYDSDKDCITKLIQSIVDTNPNEEIVVVDSGSSDKSYFEKIKNIAGDKLYIEDVDNKNYHVGAYWIAFKKYKRDFYYFMHDSMIVKANLSEYKSKYFMGLAWFEYSSGGNVAEPEIRKYTSYSVPESGLCLFGPVFFCQRELMEKLQNKGLDKILPTYSEHSPEHLKTGVAAYAVEGVFGIAIEQEGVSLRSNTLFGNVFSFDRFNTDWQYPVQKYFTRRA